MTHDEKIDKIIQQYFAEAISPEEAKQQLDQAYADKFLELVGKDEVQYIFAGVDTYTSSQRTVGGNQLRQELRTKLAEWKGDSNDQPE